MNGSDLKAIRTLLLAPATRGDYDLPLLVILDQRENETMHIIGTAHFVSRKAAIRYYRDYHYPNTEAAVDRKLAEGAIFIGKPEIKPIEQLFVREGRYHIQVGTEGEGK
jgi:hypothetical protein